MLLRGVALGRRARPSAPSGCAPRSRGAPVVAAGVSLRLTVSIGGVRAGGELADARRARRRRRPLPLRRQARTAATASRWRRTSRGVAAGRASPRPSAWPARWRSPPAPARARPRTTPSRSPTLATPTAERLGLPGRCRAALPARRLAARRRQGRRSPQRILEQARPARRRRVGGHAHAPGRSARRSSAASRRCARPPPRSATTTSATTATATPTASPATAIPIEARIVAAADAFAAMTAIASYSTGAHARPDAAIELRRSAGTHLDPAVVDALLDVLGLGATEDARVA